MIMKELSIEEKAKRYDEALEKSKILYEQGTITESLCYVFPELKESEGSAVFEKDIIEQKSTDKIEPKFKVGDWIVNNADGSVGRITKILTDLGNSDEFEYEHTNGCFHNCFESNYHLWTIQDAKDGDVLCTYECEEPKIVFVLKGTPKKHYALSYYCFYNIMYPHFDDSNKPGCLAPEDFDVKPASKEQRDLLFQKIKNLKHINNVLKDK